MNLRTYLMIKEATIPARSRVSLLLAPLGGGSTLDLRRSSPWGRSYTNNESPNTTTTTKATPSMPDITQYVQDSANDNAGKNKSALQELAKRHLSRISDPAFGATLGGI